MSEKKRITPAAAALTVVCLLVIGALIAFDLFLSGRECKEQTVAMDTVVTVTVNGRKSKNTAEKICQLVSTLEKENFSRYISGSDVYKTNSSKGSSVEVGSSTVDCINAAIKVSEASHGAFDITAGGIVSLWGIGTDSERVPSQAEIDLALASVNYKAIAVSGSSVSLSGGSVIDLGAIGKGAACDEIRKVLEEAGAQRCVAAVGGSVLLYGDGEFSVGIRDPFGKADDCIGSLKLNACCVSTSGSYERFFRQDGKKYHHIFDARTGYPAESGLASVTVVADSGVYSDALSTACFILGYENSLDLLKEFHAQAVFVTDNGEIKITDGLAGNFERKN
ncbi:MAG: FAD:protein FMN transferase [Clostridiales bacterium]|nr:FAD:protein FMN transferase [Clostridiales bacterium]